MAFLPAITLHLLHCHARNTYLMQGIANIIKFEGLDDCSHHFHVFSSPIFEPDLLGCCHLPGIFAASPDLRPCGKANPATSGGKG
jgi:hypothetical protein